MAKTLQQGTVTIALQGTTSASYAVRANHCLVAFITPAALTGTAFTFQASFDAETFTNVYNAGTEYSVSVGASRFVAVDPNVFQGAKYIKVVSGSQEAAARTIIMVTGEL